MNTNNTKLSYFIWPVLWLVMLSYFSNQPFQQQDIQPLMQKVVSEERLKRILPQIEFNYGQSRISYQEPYKFVQFFVRKGAHLFIYAVLGFLLAQAVMQQGLGKGSSSVLTLFLVGIAAYMDEYNQALNSHRTGSMHDVALDLVGGLIGLLIYIMIKE